MRINNWQLAFLGLGQDLIGFEKSGTRGSSDQICDHDGGHWLTVFIFKLDISVRNNSDELGTQFTIFCFWSAYALLTVL